MSENEAEEVYRKIWKKVGSPVRIPQSKMLIEYLKELIPPDEAKIIEHLGVGVGRKKTPEDIAREGNFDLGYVRSVLEKGAKEGKIAFYKNEGGYALLPFIPGFFELVIDTYSKKGKEDKIRHHAEWFKKEYRYIGHELGASDVPWSRVIPIERSIDARSEILSFERVSTLIDEARRIFVTNCICRLMYRNCDKPVETCFFFDLGSIDIGIDFLKDEGIYRELDKDKAREILTDCEKRGLVHMTVNSQKGRTFICNCCSCCCVILRGLLELHNPRAFVKSNFMPLIDEGKCDRCEACTKICPMGALYYHTGHDPDISAGKIMMSEEQCIGCGLCASHCPKGAITLTKVRADIAPEEFRDMLFELEAKRVH